MKIIQNLGVALMIGATGLVAQQQPQKPVNKGLAVNPAQLKAHTVQDPVKKPGRELKTPKAGIPGKASGGDSWFEITTRELGTFYGKGEAVGLFKFENPHDEPIDWRALTPSCQCAKAIVRVDGKEYRMMPKPKRRLVRVIKDGNNERLENIAKITIPPRAKGEVETHLDMRNIQGAKFATLDIHSTDPALPHSKLTFKAKGAKLFAVSPKEINLNKMVWNEKREFSVTVSSPLQNDWDILSMDKADKAFNVTWEKNKLGDRTQWTIKGTYGPLDGQTPGGGVLRFRTDVNGQSSFDVRILAYVQGPLEVRPGGFLTLGLIRKGKSVKKEITFQPNDGTELEATSLTLNKLTLKKEFVTVSQRRDGKNLIVELQINDDAPKGLVKGELVIGLNHPLVTEKKVMFNGFVR